MLDWLIVILFCTSPPSYPSKIIFDCCVYNGGGRWTKAGGRTSQTGRCCRCSNEIGAGGCCLFYTVSAASPATSYRSRFIADAVMRRRCSRLLKQRQKRQRGDGRVPIYLSSSSSVVMGCHDVQLTYDSVICCVRQLCWLKCVDVV